MNVSGGCAIDKRELWMIKKYLGNLATLVAVTLLAGPAYSDNRLPSTKFSTLSTTEFRIGGTGELTNVSEQQLESRIDFDSVYGIRLGASVEQLVGQLGEADGVIDVTAGIEAYYYGPNNLFYFEQGRLVRFETNPQLLPTRVQTQPQFDNVLADVEWQLPGGILRGMPMALVDRYIGSEVTSRDEHVWSLEQAQGRLDLHFADLRDPFTKQHRYHLEHISLTSQEFDTSLLLPAVSKSIMPGPPQSRSRGKSGEKAHGYNMQAPCGQPK